MRFALAIALWAAPLLGARLVATSPQTAELLFQLGVGDQVVGVSAGSEYPAEAARLPTIGMLFAPSLEKVVGLRPEWVILDSHNLNPAFESALRALKVKTFVWDTSSPDALLADGHRFLSETQSAANPAPLLKWQRCFSGLATVALTTPDRYIGFVWMDPPIVLGHGAFLSRLLEKLGFVNALPTTFHAPYVPVTQEWLIQQKVDRVFFLQHRSEEQATSLAHFAFWWPTVLPEAFALNADIFARASLTPLRHLAALPLAAPLPEVCRDAL